MRFLVDAQLPRTLAVELRTLGHEAVHTSSLPRGNATPDDEICRMADRECMVVVSKDEDFVVTHTLHGTPRKLLLVTTGNGSNRELLGLVRRHASELVAGLTDADFVELNLTSIVIHA
jgi:predicted nuclease of predicted toxin-antitoxin system